MYMNIYREREIFFLRRRRCCWHALRPTILFQRGIPGINICLYMYVCFSLSFSRSLSLFSFFYGADAVAGLHSDPPFSLSEEFQVFIISLYIYMCVYIYIYIYIYEYTCMYIYMYVYIYMFTAPTRSPGCTPTRHSPSQRSSRYTFVYKYIYIYIDR